MSRKEELIGLVPDDSVKLVEDVIDEIVFLEGRLEALKKLPFIQVNPKNAEQQRSTQAFKQYKETLQQYTNCVKLIESVIYRDKRIESEEAEESPLRRWFKDNAN